MRHEALKWYLDDEWCERKHVVRGHHGHDNDNKKLDNGKVLSEESRQEDQKEDSNVD